MSDDNKEKIYELTSEKEDKILRLLNPEWDGNKNMKLFKYIERREGKI